jgi:hypothetical protein
MNLSLEVVNLIVLVRELELTLLHLLLTLLQVHNLLGLCGLELLKLMGLNSGGLLCHLQKGTMPK